MKSGQNHASKKFVPAAAAQWLVKTLERRGIPLKKILLGVRLDKKWLHNPDAVITPCHQFKHEPIPGIIRFENEFINGISLQNFPGW